MANPGARVHVRWLSAEEHGRAAPPSGPSYFATIRYEGPERRVGEWSVRLESLRPEGRGASSAIMSFVSDKAPASALSPGLHFELFEGRWPVASGEVLPVSVPINGNHPELFKESLSLLKELHFLSRAGKDQGLQADAIRDAMEPLWRRLSEHERRQLDGLSADLYSIGETWPAPTRIHSHVLEAFNQATEANHWDAALDVLRTHERELPPADVAVMRGVAWGSLGHHLIATLFFAEAARLKPHDVTLKCLRLRSLVRAGDRQTAKDEATRLAGEDNGLLDRLLAADVLFDCGQLESGEPSVEVLRRVAALTEHVAKAWKAECVGDGPSSIAGIGFLSGAISLDILGEHARANDLYALAQPLLPNSLALAPPSSRRESSDFVTSLLQTKRQVDAQLLLSN